MASSGSVLVVVTVGTASPGNGLGLDPGVGGGWFMRDDGDDDG